MAHAEVLCDEKAGTAIAVLRRAVAFYASYGITVQRLLTNGKAERFIRTMLEDGGWAGAIYATSTQRTSALDGWLWHDNHRRAHAALSRQTPAQRLNNLLRSYTWSSPRHRPTTSGG